MRRRDSELMPHEEAFDPLEARRGYTPEPSDELESAKLALLAAGMRRGVRRSWVRRHPMALGAGLFVAGMLIGRSPLLRGVVAATALLVARTATQRTLGGIVHRLRL